MKTLRAGAVNVRRSLSFERRRSAETAAEPASSEPLEPELCLELVAGLHGARGARCASSLLAACAGGGAVPSQNRATAARSGVAPALVGLLHDGGPQDDALELLALLTEEPGDGVVHCQLVFVGLIEALLPLLVPARPSRAGLVRRGATRAPWSDSRAAALAHRLLLHLACTGDGLEGLLRDGAGSQLAALLTAAPAGEGVAAATRYGQVASFILQFHRHLSSERLVEFATDPDYAALLQAAGAEPGAGAAASQLGVPAAASRDRSRNSSSETDGRAASSALLADSLPVDGAVIAAPLERAAALESTCVDESRRKVGAGKLCVTVVEARDLVDVRRSGNMKPHVTIEVGAATMRTEACQGGGYNNPTWSSGQPFVCESDAPVVCIYACHPLGHSRAVSLVSI